MSTSFFTFCSICNYFQSNILLLRDTGGAGLALAKSQLGDNRPESNAPLVSHQNNEAEANIPQEKAKEYETHRHKRHN